MMKLQKKKGKPGKKAEFVDEELIGIKEDIDLAKIAFNETRMRMKNVIYTNPKEGKKGNFFKLNLGNNFIEMSEKYKKPSILPYVLCNYGKSIKMMDEQLSNFYCDLESAVLFELDKIVDVEIDNIEKNIKELPVKLKDLESSISKFNSAQKQNVSNDKIVNIENELDDAKNKFESAKDTYEIELMKFVAQEKQHAELYAKYLEIELKYHSKSLEILSKTLSEFHEVEEKSACEPVFGLSLQKHFDLFGQEISIVLEKCGEYIIKKGLKSPDVFYIKGSGIKVQKIKASFNARNMNFNQEYYDVCCVAEVMNQYLKELPEPILTKELEDEWIEITDINSSTRPTIIAELLKKLPKLNYVNLRYFMGILYRIAENAENPSKAYSNFAKNVGPSLLWSKNIKKNEKCITGVFNAISCMVPDFLKIFEQENNPEYNSTNKPTKRRYKEIIKPEASVDVFNIDVSREISKTLNFKISPKNDAPIKPIKTQAYIDIFKKEAFKDIAKFKALKEIVKNYSAKKFHKTEASKEIIKIPSSKKINKAETNHEGDKIETSEGMVKILNSEGDYIITPYESAEIIPTSEVYLKRSKKPQISGKSPSTKRKSNYELYNFSK